MYSYAIRRVLLIPPTLLLVTILVFISVRFVPGDVIDMMVAQMSTSGAVSGIDTDFLRKSMGLDVPIPQQYGRWLGVLPRIR